MGDVDEHQLHIQEVLVSKTARQSCQKLSVYSVQYTKQFMQYLLLQLFLLLLLFYCKHNVLLSLIRFQLQRTGKAPYNCLWCRPWFPIRILWVDCLMHLLVVVVVVVCRYVYVYMCRTTVSFKEGSTFTRAADVEEWAVLTATKANNAASGDIGICRFCQKTHKGGDERGFLYYMKRQLTSKTITTIKAHLWRRKIFYKVKIN